MHLPLARALSRPRPLTRLPLYIKTHNALQTGTYLTLYLFKKFPFEGDLHTPCKLSKSQGDGGQIEAMVDRIHTWKPWIGAYVFTALIRGHLYNSV